MNDSLPPLGIIEGFYGKPWTWQERADTIAFLAGYGYRFYLYAPKADPFLRRRWQEPHPDSVARELAALAAHCREHAVRFGLGLSPYEIFVRFDDDARAALADKLRQLDEFEPDDIAILFDDMRGDRDGLAEMQAEIVAFAAERTAAQRIIVCPTYYTDDPVLDRVFGQRPPDYVRRFGELIDPAIEICWTGPEVCSRELSRAHLDRVTNELRRRPFLWDNYPVNDGQRMSQFLHVRGFTGRPPAIRDRVAAHGINPALQPTLTRIPALTLVHGYTSDATDGPGYDYGLSQLTAATLVLGEQLGRLVHDDTLFLQDIGLDRLGEREAMLRDRYTGIDHPGAREIIAWLDGEYRITDQIVQTQ